MTLYGWDASHFDGPLSRAILDRARAEGITFFTHKIAEGLQDTEGSLDDTALAAARDAGIPFIGGYLIPRSTPTAATQVARWVQLADAGEPWWREFPGWFWQVDLERWPYDNVAAAQGITCARLLRAATGRAVVLYASRGQYGDSLTGWDGPLWNANYNAGPAYPGDGWLPGWQPYSGRVPAILQYTSSATIAGLSTCDKNAFRGSLDDFRQMIGGTMTSPLNDVQVRQVGNADQYWFEVLAEHDPLTGIAAAQDGTGLSIPNLPLQRMIRIEAKLDALAAATGGLTDADRAAIADLAAKVEQLLARLAAAGDALDG